MVNKDFTEEIVEEGLNLLFKNLGPIKTTRFLQVLSVPRGDSVGEIEGKTESMTKENALELINRTKKENPQLWQKFGLN